MNAPIKFILSLVMTSLMLLVWLTADKWQNRLPKRWPIYLTVALILSRVVVFIGAFMILKMPLAGDSAGFWSNTEQVHAGLVPFRDFSSIATPYNPLQYYILALAQDPTQMRAIFAVFEVLSFIVFLELLRRTFPERKVQLWAVLYLCSPLALWFPTLGSQEDVWILFFYTLVMLTFLIQRRALGSFVGGMIMAVGFLATKLFALFPVPLMLGLAPNRARTLIGYLAVAVAFSPIALFLGPNMISTLAGTASWGHAAPSTWIVLNAFTNGFIPTSSNFYPVLLLLTIWITSFVLWWRFAQEDKRGQPADTLRTQRFIGGWVLTWVIYSLLTAFGQTSYLMFWLAPMFILLVMDDKNRFLAVAVFIINLLAAPQGSFLFARGRPTYDLSNPAHLGMMLLDILLLASYTVCGFAAFKLLRDISVLEANDVQILQRGEKA